MHDESAWVRHLVEQLTDHQEAGRVSPWSLEDAPAGYVTRTLHAIVGVEVRVTAWEASWKLSQNRPPSDIDGVVHGLRNGGARQQEVADLVEAHRPVRVRPDVAQGEHWSVLDRGIRRRAFRHRRGR